MSEFFFINRRHPKKDFGVSCGNESRARRPKNSSNGSAGLHWNYCEPGAHGNGYCVPLKFM